MRKKCVFILILRRFSYDSNKIRFIVYACVWIMFLDISQAADTDILFHEVRKGKSISAEQYRKQLTEYWTPERRKAAKPIGMRPNKVNRTVSRQQNAAPNPTKTADGPAAMFEGTLPDKNLTSGRSISPTNLVTKTIGKVYLSSYDGDYECSASVVTAPSNSLVITSAQCVFDRNYYDWFFNWIFVPSYDIGDAPLYEWSANYFTVLRGFGDGDFPSYYNYDVGFVVLDRIGTRRVAQLTGSQGIGFNMAKFQLTFSFGYSSSAAYGEVMSACVGRPISPPCTFTGFTGQGFRCGFDGGFSGGPWIQSFVPSTGIGFITSVDSFYCTDSDPYFMQGPYFNNNIKSLYNGIRTRV